MRLTDEKAALVKGLREKHGDIVSREQVLDFAATRGISKPRWLFNSKEFRAGRGTYDLSKVTTGEPTVEAPEQASA